MEVFLCSNNISLFNAELKAEYKSRLNVKVFNRESKQKFVLGNFQVEEGQNLRPELLLILNYLQ